MSIRHIYHFKSGFSDGNQEMAEILGGKGANLARMCKIQMPVPPGFTIPCKTCILYHNNKHQTLQEVTIDIHSAMKKLQIETGKGFGNKDVPLLVSVRSGSKFSMPGMLDTILNVGLNDQIAFGKDNRLFLDSYRRLLQMYGDVVLQVSSNLFEECLNNYKESKNILLDCDLGKSDLKEIIKQFKLIIRQHSGKEFPQDVNEQLISSVCAVFDSWNNKRAKTYREINHISDDIGTAVTIQSMVFGNYNQDSASGVVFSRNPANGQKELFGEYMQNAQGEDIVAGTHTPKEISQMQKFLPDAYKKLVDYANRLEDECGDMQDIEFTVEDKNLYILQTRCAKRSAKAAIKIAVDMVSECKITKEEAIMRIKPEQIEAMLHPKIDNENPDAIAARGLPASPGAASGVAVFSTEEAIKRSQKGQKVILIKSDTSPEDIAGMNSAVAIVTTRGGMTSHAAVVARGMGKPCICALSGASVDSISEELIISGGLVKIKKDDPITVDGISGSLILGFAKTSRLELSKEFLTIMQWIDQTCKIGIRANAETQEDIKAAIKFGVDGIGLCRTEHMFFSKDRINIVRNMIMSETQEEREGALCKLLPIQKDDFKNIFKAVGKRPVTIRLLDPPLHEFLPLDEKSLSGFQKYSGLSGEFIKRRIKILKEENPMLGHRGCRLGISHPEIYKMQAEAIFSAAHEANYQCPEIMIPFVVNATELKIIKDIIDSVAKNYSIDYHFGSMIELPSAALLADKIAQHCDFLSFGTNDLTQTTLGISRDDCSKFLGIYKKLGIFKNDPFASIVEESVGKLVLDAAQKAKSATKKIKIGVCGEHAADPNSVNFFSCCQIDYVSCSPYRVPIAKLAAAQFNIANKDKRSE
jgi:pyruvate,orthophosphate dikinase